MKIAIDIAPLSSGHKVRGVGFYLENLKNALLTYFPQHEYIFFQNSKELTGKIDVVHYPYFDPFFLTLPFNQKYKTVVTVHDLTPLVFPEHFPAGIKGTIRWHIQKHNLKKVNAIIADSFASKKDIVKICGINEKKVNVAHLAASETFQKITIQNAQAKEITAKYKLPKQFMLYVGDVTWNKNLPRLVNTVKKAKLPLVMVGKSLVAKDFDATNPWNNDLVTVQKLTEGESHILKLGFVSNEELVILYNLATIFVFPSIYEGFGLPVIEAMQSGCPVITTKGGSLEEVAGNAAYFVNPYDEENLHQAIVTLFNDKKLREGLSAKGLKQAQKFSWKKTAEDTINVYNKV